MRREADQKLGEATHGRRWKGKDVGRLILINANASRPSITRRPSELFDAFRQTNRQWLDRFQAEANLTSVKLLRVLSDRGIFRSFAAAGIGASLAATRGLASAGSEDEKLEEGKMSHLDDLLRDLVVANRILSNENVVDAYGHISVRHPDNPKRASLCHARARRNSCSATT